MTTNNTFKGIDVRQTGNQLVFRAALLDSSGAIYASGTTNLYLFELQSDGSVKTSDWNDNTFKTTTCTTPSTTMTAITGNNGAYTIGLWTKSLATLTGFTVGAVYLIQIANSGASPAAQMREFQYGSAEGDLVVTSTGTGTADVQSDTRYWNGSAVAAPNVAGYPVVDAAKLLGTAFTAPNTAGTPVVDVGRWSGTSVNGTIPPDVIFTRSGTAQGGSTTTITLDAGASAVDNFYSGQTVLIRSGTGAHQSATIKSYVGSTKVATLNQTLGTALDNTSVFSLIAAGVPVSTVSGTVTATLAAPDSNVFATGTAGAGSSTTITLATALGADSLPVGAKIKITGGTGADQCRVVTGYINSTKVVTVDRAWVTNPDNTSVYALMYDDAPAVNSSLQVASSSDTGYRCWTRPVMTSSAGTNVKLESGLMDQNGAKKALTAGATCTVVIRPFGTSIALLTLNPTLNTTTGTFFINQATPGFTDDTGYVVETTIVDASSNTYGPTVDTVAVFG